MITLDYEGGEGGKKCQNIDYVICERPLMKDIRFKYLIGSKICQNVIHV